MTRLETDFKFFPVGQGGFYAGRFKVDREQFNIVYDCGTVSKKEYLNKCINNYKGSFNTIPDNENPGVKGVIDILFISHLDEDHVNGLPTLLDNYSCKNIYMPFLCDDERLCLFIEYVYDLVVNDRKIDENYLSFIESPHKFIKYYCKDCRINYILGNSEGDPDKGDSDKGDSDKGNIELYDNLEIIKNGYEKYFKDEFSNDNIFLKKGNGNLYLGPQRISNFWEFYLYHDNSDINKELFDFLSLYENNKSEFLKEFKSKQDLEDLKNKCKDFEKYLNNYEVESEQINNYVEFAKLSLIKNNSFNVSSLEELLKCEEKRKKLKEIIKGIGTKRKKLKEIIKGIGKKTTKLSFINSSSLVILHKPIIQKNITKPNYYLVKTKIDINSYNLSHLLSDFHRCHDCHHCHDCHCKYPCVTLLTGDIGLKQLRGIEYIKKYFKNLLVLQVPHHGSDTDWDSNLISQMNNSLRFTYAVVNFGLGNSYKHPKDNVICDLFKENYNIITCNQIFGFSYSFDFRIV